MGIMKKYILLALVSALVLPVASRAETGSDATIRLLTPPPGKLQRVDYAGAVKIKLEDGKLVTEQEEKVEKNRVQSSTVFQVEQKRPVLVEQFKAGQASGDSKVKHYLGAITPRFGGLVEKLEKLTTRIEAHLSRLKERGVEISAAQEQLNIAKAAIASAKAEIATLPRQLGTLADKQLTSTNDGQTIRAAVQKVLALVKTANTETQTLMKIVRGLSLPVPQAETAQPR